MSRHEVVETRWWWVRHAPVPDGVAATVDFVENLGNEVIVHAVLESGGRVVARTSPRALRPGGVVHVRASQGHLHVFDRGGAALWHGADV